MDIYDVCRAFKYFNSHSAREGLKRIQYCGFKNWHTLHIVAVGHLDQKNCAHTAKRSTSLAYFDTI